MEIFICCLLLLLVLALCRYRSYFTRSCQIDFCFNAISYVCTQPDESYHNFEIECFSWCCFWFRFLPFFFIDLNCANRFDHIVNYQLNCNFVWLGNFCAILKIEWFQATNRKHSISLIWDFCFRILSESIEKHMKILYILFSAERC